MAAVHSFKRSPVYWSKSSVRQFYQQLSVSLIESGEDTFQVMQGLRSDQQQKLSLFFRTTHFDQYLSKHAIREELICSDKAQLQNPSINYLHTSRRDLKFHLLLYKKPLMIRYIVNTCSHCDHRLLVEAKAKRKLGMQLLLAVTRSCGAQCLEISENF